MYNISFEVKMPTMKDQEIEILKHKISLLESQFRQDTEAKLQKLETSRKKQIDFLGSELSCSICFEVFVKPVRLPCLHPFCQTCILQNRKNKRVCPLCRAKYTSVGRLDTYLARCIENLIEFSYTRSEKTERAKLVAARENLEKQYLEKILGKYLEDIEIEEEWDIYQFDIVIQLVESVKESFWKFISIICFLIFFFFILLPWLFEKDDEDED